MTKILLAVFILIIALFGCGQDNSTVTAVTPPSQQMKGTYKLISASGSYVYQNGVLSLDSANTITGTLIVGDVSWDEALVIDGVTYSKSNGSYNMTVTNGEIGLGIVYPNGVDTYLVTYDGLTLNLSGSPNYKWQKVSD